ncbi:MAG TPA: Glu-tRNA(Gln) amidotransferase subunit GatE [Thermoplasmata archaeon]|nr:Glu-tRNA(Gln) amidotransferase subunit GatE [Thermoplasmata archaeon]
MKVGLEVHQQLATGKLFCDCPSELSEVVVSTVSRRLRATGGENHAVDAAAAFQAARGLTYHYQTSPMSCLVEIDEEPPHRLNPEAVDVALTLAMLVKARPLDEIEVMRKIVVDGSNTAGFQRTALLAVDGSLEVGSRRYSIPTICLEEDAARKVAEAPGEITFRLDRLGVPLIEIATGPEIRDGAEAREVAEEIGGLLRSTGRVRRGIGSIREDLNVSTEGGTRIEIKGVQELRRIHRYVEAESDRQQRLLERRDELTRRGAKPPKSAIVEVTELARGPATGPFGQLLKKGGVALGLALPEFGGLLGTESTAPERLGRELADRARSVGLRGLLHSDELPGHGLEGTVLAAIRGAVGATGPMDAFVLVAAPTESVGRHALEEVRRRAADALVGIPPETRDPLPDGRTRYSRPLPGRDRMYPETDIPPLRIERERLERIARTLPVRPEVLRARLVSTYSLAEDVAHKLQRSGEWVRFEEFIGLGRAPALVARLLTQELPALERAQEAGEFPTVPNDRLNELLVAVERGAFSKEGIPKVLDTLARTDVSVEEAIRRSGLSGMERSELDRLAKALVEQNLPMIRARGAEAFSPLMGDLMREVRGRRDGREVAEALRAALEKAATRGGP